MLERAEEAMEAALAMSHLENAESFENGLIAEEVRLACLQGMLLCLSREVRLAFIIDERSVPKAGFKTKMPAMFVPSAATRFSEAR